jgi:hypothetical protein
VWFGRGWIYVGCMGIAILRTLMTVRAHVKPLAPAFLVRLTAILSIVADRPSNPHFTHYLFEALSAIVRCVPGVP